MNGAALFVGIPEFQHKDLSKLPAVITDVKNFTNAFKKLGFNCRSLQKDVIKANFEDTLDEVIKDVIDNNREYLALSISSHGAEYLVSFPPDVKTKRVHFIWFNDGELTTQSILDRLKKEELKDVTKLVMISACRSRPDSKSQVDNIDQGVEIELVDRQEDEYTGLSNAVSQSGATPANTELVLPDLPQNTILWYSSPSGKYEYDSMGTGSYFVNKVCSELNKIPSSDSRSIMDVMCAVHKSLASMEDKTIVVEDENRQPVKVYWKTVPSFIHNLSKSLSFIKT
ncbi:hypothetical protein FSP39_024798 [Pinctada imbricata]|uniref:Caspase family p20 domain-containing protein n=1 Tax=Pinctada imbricata TaxID=66713 RepID=A0AA88Y0X7_PINIB|nr:hypothetical protein FSP39_024798 [Pinctada imbricata]